MDGDSVAKAAEWLPLCISKTDMGSSGDGNPNISIEISETNDVYEEILKHDMKEKDDIILPDEELSAKILQRVEYLFSDSNLSKDNFLLKHIRRDKKGYVSLKLIASSRRVKALAKDWRFVAQSLLPSQKLKMNYEMSKIRRLDPVDDSSFSTFSKVLVFEMPPNVKAEEDVKNLLNRFGKVISASIISSESTLKSSHCTPSCKGICASTYAIAEFESPEEASRATKHISNANQSFVVAPLLDNSRGWKKSKSPLPSPRTHQCQTSSCDSGWKLSSPDYSSDEVLQSPSRVDEYASLRKNQHRRKKSTNFHLENDHRDGQRISPGPRREDIAISSSWKQKRQMSSKCEKNSVIVIREPKGPDGTIGFHAGRAKASLKIHVL